MAWIVDETLEYAGFKVFIEKQGVVFDHVHVEHSIALWPKTRDEAHTFALMLRKSARRLEEIGKGLTNG